MDPISSIKEHYGESSDDEEVLKKKADAKKNKPSPKRIAIDPKTGDTELIPPPANENETEDALEAEGAKKAEAGIPPDTVAKEGDK